MARKKDGEPDTETIDPARLLYDRIDRDRLTDSVRLACQWLTEVAQVRTESLDPARELNTRAMPYANWRGAMRGEYKPERADARENLPAGIWGFFCPVWHTGQAVKALCQAWRLLRDDRLLEGARLGGEFIMRHQNRDTSSEDFGMMRSYENFGSYINASALLEACNGLFHLSDTTDDPAPARAAIDGIQWTVRRLYRGGGLFTDNYDPDTHQFRCLTGRDGIEGRPLLDDGVLLTAARRAGDNNLRRIFYETADRLLADEDPPGNWIAYKPCKWDEGFIHPRHAFWWGRPMRMAWEDGGDSRYRDAFDRACEWYVRAMRHDGGILRNTYTDFSTPSFGHATSGTGAACMMFHDQVRLGRREYEAPLARGLRYMTMMQVREARDPNMQGVIIEKAQAPGGSDASPWHIRDLGTIFFVNAACQVLLDPS